jgi:hypothetical protein
LAPRIVNRLFEQADSATRVLLPLGAFAVLVVLGDVSDWNEGPTRAAVLALGGGALLALCRASLRPLPRSGYVWLAVVGLGVALRVTLLWPQLTSPGNHPIDVGTTTVSAVEYLERGAAIYSSPIDNQYGPGAGFSYFGGYKYGPLVPYSRCSWS